MSIKKSGNDETPSGGILQQSMDEVMHNAMMPYAEHVILERALPRVEDGLKPVQRRILYTMLELSLSPDKPHRKAARIVGDALGKYHPHGDTSVYDAMVRMAQDFNMRELLVDGHGNFGSIDGDSAAAMRYTEARLTPLSMELLRDLDKDTVPFSYNFDDTLKEPDMLPGRYPNLLVNGSSGIAVGLATNIPPHNLSEVIDGVIAQIDNPLIDLKKLMTFIKGPDFPTGGILTGLDELEKAYETGRGKITLRAKTSIENASNSKKTIVIHELPYQINKANLLEKILKLSEDKKGILSGISDIRDESDRNGMRAVIEIRKEADADRILNYLYKCSDLQITYGINIVAIAEGKPMQLGLLAINKYYIHYQKEVILRRTRYDVEYAKEREHILSGLMIAINNIDEVIKIIRMSKSPKEAKTNLITRYVLTDIQAQAILDMRLQRLTGLEIISLEKEYREVQRLIKKLEEILKSENKLMNIIRSELLEIKEKYKSPRRTVIGGDLILSDSDPNDYAIVEDVIISVTSKGYIKRMAMKTFNRSNRDIDTVETIDQDYILHLIKSSTDQRILLFTPEGLCFQLDCNSIPEGKWKDKGIHISNIINSFGKEDKVISILSIKDFSINTILAFYTSQGIVKRSSLNEYNTKKTRIKACTIKSNDTLISVELCQSDRTLLLLTKYGMSININLFEITTTGRISTGIKVINLLKDDTVIFASQINQEGEIIIFSDKGYAKRYLASDWKKQKRSTSGIKTFRFNKNHSNGVQCIKAFYVKDPFTILLFKKHGTITKFYTEDIPIDDFTTNGTMVAMVLLDDEIEQVYRIFS